MPEFTPNTIMLDKHADKGDEPCEIFAWCVRDAISKHSKLRKVDNSFQQKKGIVEFMQGKTNFVEVDGKRYGDQLFKKDD